MFFFVKKEAGEASFQIYMGMENWYIHVKGKQEGHGYTLKVPHKIVSES